MSEHKNYELTLFSTSDTSIKFNFQLQILNHTSYLQTTCHMYIRWAAWPSSSSAQLPSPPAQHSPPRLPSQCLHGISPEPLSRSEIFPKWKVRWNESIKPSN